MKYSRTFTLCLVLTLLVKLALLFGCGANDADQRQAHTMLTKELVENVNTAKNLLKRYLTVIYAQLNHIGGNTMLSATAKQLSGDTTLYALAGQNHKPVL